MSENITVFKYMEITTSELYWHTVCHDCQVNTLALDVTTLQQTADLGRRNKKELYSGYFYEKTLRAHRFFVLKKCSVLSCEDTTQTRSILKYTFGRLHANFKGCLCDWFCSFFLICIYLYVFILKTVSTLIMNNNSLVFDWSVVFLLQHVMLFFLKYKFLWTCWAP